MKIVLNQYFPLIHTEITEKHRRPHHVKETDAESVLFLRSDTETRVETTRFLQQHFENETLTTDIWRHHVRDLKDRSVRIRPSFGWIRLTDPVQIVLGGSCQVVHCHQGQILSVFKSESETMLSSFDSLAVMDGYWLLAASDDDLKEPLQKMALDAMRQTDYPFEEFFFNQILEAGVFSKFNITIVQAQEIVDLESEQSFPYLEKRLKEMLNRVPLPLQTLIQHYLQPKKTSEKGWFGWAAKTNYEVLYKALQTDLDLKRKEIALLQQQSNVLKVAELERDLKRKSLETNDLQTQMKVLNKKINTLELAQKGIETLQKELEVAKQTAAELTLGKKQLIQQLKELQSVQNQSVTQKDSLFKQLTDTQLQLDKVQKEKQVLQKTQDETAKYLWHKSNDLERLQKEKEQLQQVQNQSVTQQNGLLNQLKVAQAEKEYLQRIQNQSVAQNAQLSEKLKSLETYIAKLESDNSDLQRVHNQSVTQNEALFKIGQNEILRLQKLLDLKMSDEPLKPIVIPTPPIPKPIIVTQPTIKTKLPFEPEMILVEGGTFKMGGQVTLSNFMIGKYPITQAQWKAVMGNNPSYFKGDDLPVETVSWHDAQDFISKLNDNKTGKTYSLPTEAQWEFAARGGNKSKGYEYSGSHNLSEVGWFKDNSESKTHPVDGKAANELLIHDMSGNVWEWCSDWYGSYSDAAVTNPTGATKGTNRVLRGGSWFHHAGLCRVANRDYNSPSYRSRDFGFRVVSFP